MRFWAKHVNVPRLCMNFDRHAVGGEGRCGRSSTSLATGDDAVAAAFVCVCPGYCGKTFESVLILAH